MTKGFPEKFDSQSNQLLTPIKTFVLRLLAIKIIEKNERNPYLVFFCFQLGILKLSDEIGYYKKMGNPLAQVSQWQTENWSFHSHLKLTIKF